ncbi:MAG TPA: FCD domain-containing protein [Xanthobacteraceae bacterium]|jgi:GntR family carbon starvation induced transcriptional regulator
MPPTLARSVPSQTLNASVLAQLRSDIIACRLMPNERLRVEALRERYGMGFSPIREALMRLEAEGLVELEQNKGFRVSEVSRENLFDLMRTRIEIESIALRWSLEKGGVEWEADLLGAFHRLSRQTKIDPANPDAISEAWSKEHADFHAALVAASGSPTLLSIRARLFEQAERYVALSIMSSGPLRDDVTEHKNLMRAALNREVDKAVELNRVHITRTLDKVATSLAAAATSDDLRPSSRKTSK